MTSVYEVANYISSPETSVLGFVRGTSRDEIEEIVHITGSRDVTESTGPTPATWQERLRQANEALGDGVDRIVEDRYCYTQAMAKTYGQMADAQCALIQAALDADIDLEIGAPFSVTMVDEHGGIVVMYLVRRS